jgi:hypothetical protein
MFLVREFFLDNIVSIIFHLAFVFILLLGFDFTAPLPDVGIWGEFVLGKRWGLYANVNYLSVKIDETDGRIISYNLSVLYNKS